MNGKSFAGPDDAQDLVKHLSDELGVGVIPFQAMYLNVPNMIGVGRFIEVFVDTPLEVSGE